jgi:hypothetical protein
MNEQRGRCCRLVLAPPRCSLVKGEDDEVVSPPLGGRVHPSLPPYTCRTALNPVWAWVRVLRTRWVHTQLGTEVLELPFACCRCSKFMPKTI